MPAIATTLGVRQISIRVGITTLTVDNIDYHHPNATITYEDRNQYLSFHSPNFNKSMTPIPQHPQFTIGKTVRIKMTYPNGVTKDGWLQTASHSYLGTWIGDGFKIVPLNGKIILT